MRKNWSIRSRMWREKQILWFPFKLDFSKILNRNLTVVTSGKYLVVLAGADSRKSWDLTHLLLVFGLWERRGFMGCKLYIPTIIDYSHVWGPVCTHLKDSLVKFDSEAKLLCILEGFWYSLSTMMSILLQVSDVPWEHASSKQPMNPDSGVWEGKFLPA